MKTICGYMFIYMWACNSSEHVLQDFTSLKKRQGVGDIRRVKLFKEPEEGLGMSITVSTVFVKYRPTDSLSPIITIHDILSILNGFSKAFKCWCSVTICSCLSLL